MREPYLAIKAGRLTIWFDAPPRYLDLDRSQEYRSIDVSSPTGALFSASELPVNPVMAPPPSSQGCSKNGVISIMVAVRFHDDVTALCPSGRLLTSAQRDGQSRHSAATPRKFDDIVTNVRIVR